MQAPCICSQLGVHRPLTPLWHLGCPSPKSWRYKAMTPEISQSDANLQAELDRLTYSAYLLTLDPGKAFSAVARAIDGSLQENTANRSEEHTSELQSQSNLVCRLLLEKKKT